jgi:hypothetical protein
MEALGEVAEERVVGQVLLVAQELLTKDLQVVTLLHQAQ